MQNHNLPAPAELNAYALQQQTAPEVVPPVYAQYVPNLDGYSSVCVHVRESSFIASQDPIPCQHQDAHRVLPLIDNNGAGIPPVGAAPPATTSKGKPRFRLTAGHIALWMCVGQLAVIIWLLAGQSFHLDKAVSGIKDTISAAVGPKLTAIWHAAGVSDDPEQIAAGENQKSSVGKGKRSKGKGSRSKKQSPNKGAGFSWPLASNFVPPPPPELSNSKMMVPPPPVAYSLYEKAPGAVAASTLPPPPVTKKIAEPAAAAAANSPAPATTAAPTPVASLPPTPAKAATPATPPTAAAAPVVPPTSAPLPGPQLEPTISAVPLMAAPAVVHYNPGPAPTPPTRTVMSGNRKRVITDR